MSSTKTMPEEERKPIPWRLIVISFVLILVGFILVITLGMIYSSKPYKYNKLSISVESTEVKAFNLTENNHLFLSMNMDIRAHNHITYSSMDLHGISVEVKKASGGLVFDEFGDVSLCPDCESVFDVEVMDAGHVELKEKIADELRRDVSVGEGRVDVFIVGYFYDWRGFSYPVYANCRDVVLDFTGLGKKLQMVGCQVERRD